MAERLIDFCTEHYRFRSFTVIDDILSMRMWQGRNDEEVRRRSVNQAEITLESHHAFVKSLLGREDVRYLAVTNKEGDVAGCVNLHFEDEGHCTVSRGIWIAAEARGNGTATQLLDELYDYLFRTTPLLLVKTQVRIDNERSHALERRLGATETGRDDNYVYYEFHKENRL